MLWTTYFVLLGGVAFAQIPEDAMEHFTSPDLALAHNLGLGYVDWTSRHFFITQPKRLYRRQVAADKTVTVSSYNTAFSNPKAVAPKSNNQVISFNSGGTSLKGTPAGNTAGQQSFTVSAGQVGTSVGGNSNSMSIAAGSNTFTGNNQVIAAGSNTLTGNNQVISFTGDGMGFTYPSTNSEGSQTLGYNEQMIIAVDNEPDEQEIEETFAVGMQVIAVQNQNVELNQELDQSHMVIPISGGGQSIATGNLDGGTTTIVTTTQGQIHFLGTKDEEPVVGLPVTVTNGKYDKTVPTNQEGKAVFDKVPVGDYTVTAALTDDLVVKTGPLDGKFVSVPVKTGKITDLEMEFKPDTLEYIVVDVNGNTYPKDTIIGVYDPTGELIDEVPVIDDNGRVVIPIPPAGEYDLKPTVPGSTDEDGITVAVPPTSPDPSVGIIRGDVYLDANNNFKIDAGEAIPKVDVVLTGPALPTPFNQPTGPNGRYSFPGLKPGVYNVQVGDIPGIQLPASVPTGRALVVEENNELIFDVRIPPLATIHGVVFEDVSSNKVADPGEGRAGFKVQALDNTGIVVGTTTTDPTGSYELPKIVSGTNYTVTAADNLGNAQQKTIPVPGPGKYPVDFMFETCCYSPFGKSYWGKTWEVFDQFSMAL